MAWTLLIGLALAQGPPLLVELESTQTGSTFELGGFPLSDDGLPPDRVAGDGVHIVVLPSSVVGPVQLSVDGLLLEPRIELPRAEEGAARSLSLGWDGQRISGVPEPSAAQGTSRWEGAPSWLAWLGLPLLVLVLLGLVWGPKRRSLRPRRGLRRRLVFSLVPLLLLALVAELGTRLLVPRASFSAGGPLGWTASPELEGLQVPMASGHFLVSTNADGLRTELSRERGPTERWVTLGDSTVFGWGVSVEDSPAGVLERLVPGIEVLNAGQPGYSSEQARRLAERVLPAYRPDRVIWFHPWHDLASATPDRELLPTQLGPLRSLLGRSAVVQLLRRPQAQGSELFVFHPELGGSSQRVPSEHRWDNLERLDRACRSIEAELLLVLLPVEGGGHTGPLSVDLERAGESFGAPFVDLNAQASPRPWVEITVEGDPGHLNAEGNRIYMERLLRALGESG